MSFFSDSSQQNSNDRKVESDSFDSVHRILDASPIARKNNSEREAIFKELNDHRERVFFYLNYATKLSSRVEILRNRVFELESEKSNWFVPEIKKLQDAMESFEETRKNWYEPELNRQSEYIRYLDGELRVSRKILQSRSHRIASRMQKGYNIPLVGSFMRGVNKLLRVLWPL